MPIPRHPNYTQFPNTFLDNELADLSFAEWKVLCYIVRHTFGWQRDATILSYKQFMHGCHDSDGRAIDKGCGITSSTTLGAALRTLEQRGLIRREHHSTARGGKDSSGFCLVFDEGDEATPLPAAASATPTTKNGHTHKQKSGIGSTENGHATPAAVHPSISTKETVRKETGPKDPVTPVDISTKVDNSAQGARAREAPKPVPLHRDTGTLDPLPDWVLAIAQQIQEHWGGDLLPKEREEWREWVWQNLHSEDPAQRTRFLTYAFDNKYIPQLSSPRGVLTFLTKDLDSWRRSGRPTVKGLRRAEGGKTAPKVPAHIQREHDLSYKPRSRKIDATSSPEEIAATLADLRKSQGGEEIAQKWLRSIGLSGEGA